jgi:hypothetical protein
VLKLQVIVGSSRPTRAADRVAPWVIDRDSAHPAFDVEVLDLRDWPLPHIRRAPRHDRRLQRPHVLEPARPALEPQDQRSRRLLGHHP